MWPQYEISGYCKARLIDCGLFLLLVSLCRGHLGFVSLSLSLCIKDLFSHVICLLRHRQLKSSFVVIHYLWCSTLQQAGYGKTVNLHHTTLPACFPFFFFKAVTKHAFVMFCYLFIAKKNHKVICVSQSGVKMKETGSLYLDWMMNVGNWLKMVILHTDQYTLQL